MASSRLHYGMAVMSLNIQSVSLYGKDNKKKLTKIRTVREIIIPQANGPIPEPGPS
jgi:hypothetical protein